MLDIFPVYLICIYYILVILYLNRLLFILCTYNILNCNFVFEICIEHFYFEFFDFEHFPSDIFTSKNFYPSSNLLFLDIFDFRHFYRKHFCRLPYSTDIPWRSNGAMCTKYIPNYSWLFFSTTEWNCMVLPLLWRRCKLISQWLCLLNKHIYYPSGGHHTTLRRSDITRFNDSQ